MQQIPPRVRRLLEPLPFPVRFSDGQIRLATGRLALLRRYWAHFPASKLESSQVLNVYSGGDMLDIGAFHGWYSVLLAPHARSGDRFVSFEPNADALPMLNAMLRDLGRHFPSVALSVVTEPVGDGSAVTVSRPMGWNGHPRFAHGDGPGSVPSLSLDEFVRSHGLRPRLVKVDVEGAELAVLRGMRETLTEHQPTLMLEIHPQWQPEGVQASDVETFMRDAGYQGKTLEDVPVARRQIWRPAPTA